MLSTRTLSHLSRWLWSDRQELCDCTVRDVQSAFMHTVLFVFAFLCKPECVWQLAVLSVSSHLRARPVYLSARSYVHCGFSASRAARSWTQISAVVSHRGGFLSSLKTRSTYPPPPPPPPPCFSSLSTSVDAAWNAAEPRATPSWDVALALISPSRA